jgi:hypothetical protein
MLALLRSAIGRWPRPPRPVRERIQAESRPALSRSTMTTIPILPMRHAFWKTPSARTISHFGHLDRRLLAGHPMSSPKVLMKLRANSLGRAEPPLGAGARSENMTTPASAVPVSYQTDRAKTPWWGVSPGDIWWDQYRKGMTGLYNFLRSGLGGGGGRRRKSEEECEEQYREDGDICRARHSRTCWEQAAVRYKNCLHGDQIPPLGFGGR